MYSNYNAYKTLVDIDKTHSESTLDEKLPVAYKYFKGTNPLFSFTVFLASSLDKKYMKNRNDYLGQRTVHFVIWYSHMFGANSIVFAYMVTTFVNVRYISLKVRFYLC